MKAAFAGMGSRKKKKKEPGPKGSPPRTGPPLGGQPSEIASVGQAEAHTPQLMQILASITRLPSCSLIALCGHSPSHAPQFMQASEILYAMVILLAGTLPVPKVL